MNILVTGSAGFIGFHVIKKLFQNKINKVFGIDNFNNYYDVKIKHKRNEFLKKNKNFFFNKIDISNKKKLFNYIKQNKINYIVHLAAQAGVRHSLSHPEDYLKSNLIGFFNILEASRFFKIKHLLFASTSSVYGLNERFPFKENQLADHPIQFYAATKRSNELMAHSYSYLYNIPMTACRFFTVYGPWGRPDMALFKFTKNIIEKKKIDIFNYGNHARDFTYCDDVANIVKKLLIKIPKKNHNFKKYSPDPGSSPSPFQVFNVSSGKRVALLKFVEEIEKNLNLQSIKNFMPLQTGDIPNTLSSRTKIKSYLGTSKTTDYKTGIKRFINWYKEYYKIK